MFKELMRETRLLDQRLTAAKADEAFAKFAKVSTLGRITYGQFLESLALLAVEKGIHVEALVARVEWASAPAKLLMEDNTEMNKELKEGPKPLRKQKKQVGWG